MVSGSFVRQDPAPLDPVDDPRPEADRPVAPGTPAPPTAPRRVTRRGWLLALPGAAVLLPWMYALTVHANSAAVNSDGATVILQGRAVASGNVLLHGWILSLDSWWTLDVVFYGLLTAVMGVRGDLLYAGPALIAGLVVIVGVVIARRGRRGAAAAAGMVTVAAVLALPTHTLATYLMCGPIHVSTVLYALVAFLGLRRNHFGWGWVMAVLLLAAGMLGDLQMVSYGVVPALVAGLAAAARRRSIRAGSAAVSAAVCSVALALVVRALVVALGGFSLGATNKTASAYQMVENVTRLSPVWGQFLGLGDSINGSGGVPFALQSVHIVLAGLLAATLVTGIVRLLRGVWHGTVASGSARTDEGRRARTVEARRSPGGGHHRVDAELRHPRCDHHGLLALSHGIGHLRRRAGRSVRHTLVVRRPSPGPTSDGCCCRSNRHGLLPGGERRPAQPTCAEPTSGPPGGVPRIPRADLRRGRLLGLVAHHRRERQRCRRPARRPRPGRNARGLQQGRRPRLVRRPLVPVRGVSEHHRSLQPHPGVVAHRQRDLGSSVHDVRRRRLRRPRMAPSRHRDQIPAAYLNPNPMHTRWSVAGCAPLFSCRLRGDVGPPQRDPHHMSSRSLVASPGSPVVDQPMPTTGLLRAVPPIDP